MALIPQCHTQEQAQWFSWVSEASGHQGRNFVLRALLTRYGSFPQPHYPSLPRSLLGPLAAAMGVLSSPRPQPDSPSSLMGLPTTSLTRPLIFCWGSWNGLFILHLIASGSSLFLFK